MNNTSYDALARAALSTCPLPWQAAGPEAGRERLPARPGTQDEGVPGVASAESEPGHRGAQQRA